MCQQRRWTLNWGRLEGLTSIGEERNVFYKGVEASLSTLRRSPKKKGERNIVYKGLEVPQPYREAREIFFKENNICRDGLSKPLFLKSCQGFRYGVKHMLEVNGNIKKKKLIDKQTFHHF